MPKVFIVEKEWNAEVKTMFYKRGWSAVNDPEDADLIQFIGGADVSPSLYQEEKHATTKCDPERDERECSIFYSNLGKPMSGICRGGQLLNVLSGGKLWQHVDRHTTSHMAYLPDDNRGLFVTSTHHQMMRPSDDAVLIATAKISTMKETGSERFASGDSLDVEAVFYPNTNCLCYQPHPEYVNEMHLCQTLYFDLIKKWFNV